MIAVKHEIQFGTAKTAKGRRVVALDKTTAAASGLIPQRQLEERLLVGAGWVEHDRLFPTPLGGPLHPERF